LSDSLLYLLTKKSYSMENVLENISVKTEKKTEKSMIDTIYERRAVRKYQNRPVEKRLIDKIIQAARMAPSAMDKQVWRFYILTNPEEIALFSKMISRAVIKGVIRSGIKSIIKTTQDFLHFSHNTDFLKTEDPIFHGAPAVIFITSPKEDEWATLDIGMCAQNIMLAAKSFGLETCPVGLAKFVEQTKQYPKLKIPETEEVQLAVVLGYGDEKPEMKERKQDNCIYL